MYEFKITGIVLEEDKGELQLQGKFHPVFTSMVFLKLPPSELAGRNIGDKFILTGAPEMVQREDGTPRCRHCSSQPIEPTGSKYYLWTHVNPDQTKCLRPSPEDAAHEDSDRPESQVQAADEIERKGGYQI